MPRPQRQTCPLQPTPPGRETNIQRAWRRPTSRGDTSDFPHVEMTSELPTGSGLENWRRKRPDGQRRGILGAIVAFSSSTSANLVVFPPKPDSSLFDRGRSSWGLPRR
jgi:hypothetical protein